ncbi:hypothetical protein ACLOJK_004194 [Asimina triloba]
MECEFQLSKSVVTPNWLNTTPDKQHRGRLGWLGPDMLDYKGHLGRLGPTVLDYLYVRGIRTASSDHTSGLVRTLEAFLRLRLNEQSVLLDPPLFSFLSENVASNDFIELTNGIGMANAELSCELKVLNALDEGRHIYLCEEA